MTDTVTLEYLSDKVPGFSSLNSLQQQRILKRLSIFVSPSDLDNLEISNGCFNYCRKPLGSSTYHVEISFNYGS